VSGLINNQQAAVRPSLGQRRRIVVKVGTSTLTHANGHLHLGRMEALVRQLADVMGEEKEQILVTSAAISAGMGRMGLKERPASLTEKQALAAVGQGVLMHQYEKLFAEYGIKVAQVLLTKEDLDHPYRSRNARETVACLLQWGVVPIVNENDVVASDEIKVGDNDTLSARVAVLARADLLIILSDVDGVYPADPRTTNGISVLSWVPEVTIELERVAGGAGSSNGTGGMVTKLQAARIANAAGIPLVVANGSQPGVIRAILAGEPVGTLIGRV
jgi:glutamate 5-kinase